MVEVPTPHRPQLRVVPCDWRATSPSGDERRLDSRRVTDIGSEAVRGGVPLTQQAGSAAERWRRLVNQRLTQRSRMLIERDAVGPSFPGCRLESIGTATSPPWWLPPGRPLHEVRDDPFLWRLRRVTDRTSSVLDVGAGTGRFALALAPFVRQMTAVDEHEDNVIELERQARLLGIRNVRVVLGRWEEVNVEPADVAFSSYVLPLVEDAPRFLAKLRTSSLARVLLYQSAFDADALFAPLWRHFYGMPRSTGPSHLDLAEVLRELGVSPTIDIVSVPDRLCFSTIDDAVEALGTYLLLPDTDIVRGDLHELALGCLSRRGHLLCPPLHTAPAAIIAWTEGDSHVQPDAAKDPASRSLDRLQ